MALWCCSSRFSVSESVSALESEEERESSVDKESEAEGEDDLCLTLILAFLVCTTFFSLFLGEGEGVHSGRDLFALTWMLSLCLEPFRNSRLD